MSAIKTLSLFTGAGGLDVGFHNAGFEILACVELEAKYCETLLSNREEGIYLRPETNIHNIDIRKFDPTPYKDAGIECIIGGPPCQTFSAAGRRSGGVIGTQDLRGQLYEEYCNILDIIRPKVFVFENVYGLPGANGGEPWKQIVKAFSDHGYTLFAEVLDAADYGVPQHRERLVMVGVRDGSYVFPMPTHGPDSITGTPLISVEAAIADLQIPNEKPTIGLGGLYGHLLPEVPEGLNYAFFTAEMGHPEPVFAWRSKFHDLLYKVNRNEPCRTIKASPGKFTGPFHWNNRHFTIDELKRLQSFPDDYRIVGSYGRCVEQIGNSVPPQLAFKIATSVKEQIFNPTRSCTFEPRPAGFKSTFRQRQRARSKCFHEIAARAIKDRYGSLTEYSDNTPVVPETKEFYTTYHDKYSRAVHDKKPAGQGHFFKISSIEAASHIRLDIDEQQESAAHPLNLEIKISGLGKYLPNFQTLTLSANLAGMSGIFFAWKEVEAALVSRSKFFTLIDIYGHYANRGDTVEIVTTMSFDSKASRIGELIEYFSQSINCGDFITTSSLLEKFDLEHHELSEIVSSMRRLRFDIRTDQSHPIIGQGRIICTYPFPLLSAKALVESKAKFTTEEAVDAE